MNTGSDTSNVEQPTTSCGENQPQPQPQPQQQQQQKQQEPQQQQKQQEQHLNSPRLLSLTHYHKPVHESKSACVPHDARSKFRLVVMGQGSVGKTALIKRFLDNRFPDTYQETVEDLHTRFYRINGVKIHAEVLDTAGNLSFPAMRRISIANATAFLLVYSITDRSSFHTVQNLIKEICEVRKNDLDKVAAVVVGNMIDSTDRRQVSASQVTQWLIENTANLRTNHMETSAKNGYQVPEVFQMVVKLSGVLEVLAASGAPPSAPVDSTPSSATSFDAKTKTTRFSFSRAPFFNRSKSVVTAMGVPPQQQQLPQVAGAADSVEQTPYSPKTSTGQQRIRRDRTRSNAGYDEDCNECKVQ